MVRGGGLNFCNLCHLVLVDICQDLSECLLVIFCPEQRIFKTVFLCVTSSFICTVSPNGHQTLANDIIINIRVRYPNFLPAPTPVLIFGTKFFRYRYRYLFSKPNFSGSGTKFFWYRHPYLFSVLNFTGSDIFFDT